MGVGTAFSIIIFVLLHDLGRRGVDFVFEKTALLQGFVEEFLLELLLLLLDEAKLFLLILTAFLRGFLVAAADYDFIVVIILVRGFGVIRKIRKK